MFKKLFDFLYHFLFIDSRTGKLSHSRWWSNVGYLLMCYAFVRMLHYGVNVDLNLLVIFSVVVIGNKSLQDWIKKG